MKRDSMETFLGLIVLLFCSIFLVMIYSVSSRVKKSNFSQKLTAKFRNIDGISIGSDVKIAGVKVGYVEDITLDDLSFRVSIDIAIKKGLKIPVDSSLSVTTDGIFGGKYLLIKPGFEEEYLDYTKPFQSTESSISIEGLISKFASK